MFLRLHPCTAMMQRADSLEKTLMLGRTEGMRRRGRQRIRWSDGITNSVDMSVSKLQEMVKDREVWHAASMESQRVAHNLAIQQQQHSVLWGCPGHRRMFISIPGPHPLDASSTPPLTVITRNVLLLLLLLSRFSRVRLSATP